MDMNEIAIVWTIDDVKELDSTLSDLDCRCILESVKKHHDATIGVNWDTIQDEIDTYKDIIHG